MKSNGFTIKCNKCGTEVQVYEDSPYCGSLDTILMKICDDYEPTGGKVIAIRCEICDNKTE